MKPEVRMFLAVQLVAVILGSLAAARPDIESFRPEIISQNPTTNDIMQIVMAVLIGTAVLVVIRLIGWRLRLLVDASVFVATFYLASIFTGLAPSLLAAAAAVILRATPYLAFLNLTAFVSIESFSILFGLFLKYDLVILLLAAMSLYDVLAVFYTKHMRFLWFGGWLNARVEQPRWRDTLAFFFPGEGVSVIGAGDFALPAVLVVSVQRSGGWLAAAIVAAGCCAGFVLLEYIAERSRKAGTTGIPGVPTITLGALMGVLISRASGLLA